MRTELDRKFDETLAQVTGPGGRIIIERDELGRAFVANFPATLPMFFKTFCALNGQVEALVAGDERLTFADLDHWSDRLAQGARHARHPQGRPRRHRHAQLPGLGRRLHGHPQGRRRGDPAQRLVGSRGDGACARADRAGADPRRSAARQAHCRALRPCEIVSSRRSSGRIGEALARSARRRRRGGRAAGHQRRRTTPPSSSRPARPAKPRARCRPTGR